MDHEQNRAKFSGWVRSMRTIKTASELILLLTMGSGWMIQILFSEHLLLTFWFFISAWWRLAGVTLLVWLDLHTSLGVYFCCTCLYCVKDPFNLSKISLINSPLLLCTVEQRKSYCHPSSGLLPSQKPAHSKDQDVDNPIDFLQPSKFVPTPTQITRHHPAGTSMRATKTFDGLHFVLIRSEWWQSIIWMTVVRYYDIDAD